MKMIEIENAVETMWGKVAKQLNAKYVDGWNVATPFKETFPGFDEVMDFDDLVVTRYAKSWSGREFLITAAHTTGKWTIDVLESVEQFEVMP